jgi:hypothetical protein
MSLMSAHGLSRRDVADLLCRNPSSIDDWFYRPGSAGFRQIPDRDIEILERELAWRAQAES